MRTTASSLSPIVSLLTTDDLRRSTLGQQRPERLDVAGGALGDVVAVAAANEEAATDVDPCAEGGGFAVNHANRDIGFGAGRDNAANGLDEGWVSN